MSRGWDRPYPVMVLTGNDDFMRDRELSRARRAAGVTGRRFVSVPEGDGEALRAILSASFLVSDPCIAVLESGLPRRRGQTGSWTDADADLVLEHHAADDAADVALVVSHAGAVPDDGFVRRVVDGVGKRRVLSWTAPKPWEGRDAAAKFLRSEVSRLGCTISEEDAVLAVRVAGTDRWLMTQEALKYVTLARVDGRETVARADVLSLAAPFASEYREDLVAAVAAGNQAGVVRALASARGGGDGDTPVSACGHLARTLSKWIHVAAIMESRDKVSDEDIAGRVGVNVYVMRNNMVEPARRWGVRRLTRLLKDVAGVERGVKQGRINPWVMLEAALLRHCRSASVAPR